tara:strand:+ start:1020 stop:1229 length:210 start_codon:yes stop_codon:yes gene_type:complete
MADKKTIKYVVTLSYDPDTKKAELISEEFVDGIDTDMPMPILFKGNAWVLDYMDEESISSINSFEIGET